jgi:NAD-dependent deacetylase
MHRAIVILTGAGISVESGLPVYRGSQGLWENRRLEELASPEAFRREPQLVHRFYNERRHQLRRGDIRPNHAHRALARLEADFDGELLLVTQNVDDLHERAGSRQVRHLHGSLLRGACVACSETFPVEGALSVASFCPACGARGSLRPDVVWFGELPRHLDETCCALDACDLFVAIGTSGAVYPAAGFAERARRAGAFTVQINPELTEAQCAFRQHIVGPAGTEVPRWVNRLLAGTHPA